MREVPRHIQCALTDYDPQLSIVWDQEYHGWRLTYDGEPQQFILEHCDGTTILNLDTMELMDIVNRTDQYKHHDALAKARMRGASIRERRNIAARKFVDQDVRQEMRSLADHVINRGSSAKPFSHVKDNPLAKGA